MPDIHGYKILTHDFCSPIAGGSPILQGSISQTYTVDSNTRSGKSGVGWYFTKGVYEAAMFGGLWPAGRPGRLFRVRSIGNCTDLGECCRADGLEFLEEIPTAGMILELGKTFFEERHVPAMVDSMLEWSNALRRPQYSIGRVTASMLRWYSNLLTYQEKLPEFPHPPRLIIPVDRTTHVGAEQVRIPSDFEYIPITCMAWIPGAVWTAEQTCGAWAAHDGLHLQYFNLMRKRDFYNLLQFVPDNLYTSGIREAFENGMSHYAISPEYIHIVMEPDKDGNRAETSIKIQTVSQAPGYADTRDEAWFRSQRHAERDPFTMRQL